jgi:hypothetical protein
MQQGIIYTCWGAAATAELDWSWQSQAFVQDQLDCLWLVTQGDDVTVNQVHYADMPLCKQDICTGDGFELLLGSWSGLI